MGWKSVAALLVAWIMVVWILALRGVFEPVSGASQLVAAADIVVPTVIAVAAVLTLLTRSRVITAAVDAAPASWLILYQAYRVAGFVFVRLWWQGFLPGFFALPAGIGDMLTGVFAVLVAVAVRRNSLRARALAYALNLFGIVDLVNAISMGALSTFVSTASAGPGTSLSGVSPLQMYPLVIVPSFGVPLAFIIRCLSICQLRRRSQLSADLSFDEEGGMRKSA
jgi:hypothetical protein